MSDHDKCIVRSYLQWLQDSDAEAICTLCSKSFEGECVRLVCLDIFHIECLDKYCKQFPAHTASAGYVCPSCKVPLLPQPNHTNPLAVHVRQVFADAPWTKLVDIPVPKLPPTPSSQFSSGIAPTPSKVEKSYSKITVDPDDSSYKNPPTQTSTRLLPTGRITFRRLLGWGIMILGILIIGDVFYSKVK